MLLFGANVNITTHESGKHKLSVPSLLDFMDNFNVYGTGTDFWTKPGGSWIEKMCQNQIRRV